MNLIWLIFVKIFTEQLRYLIIIKQVIHSIKKLREYTLNL